MYQLLLVEDDLKIQDVILTFFQNKDEEKFDIEAVSNGEKALEQLYENEYDLILLDIMLPGVDGFEICKEIRKEKDVPIIFLTARGREEDILHGYDLGCDDYIIKPFSLATLYAKVCALLNRSKGTILCQELKVGNISLNPKKMIVQISNQQINLAPKEYFILKVLMEQKEAVVSREALIVRIWGYDYEGDERILDNHMKKLRSALGNEGKRIKTIIGKGYKIL